MTVRDAPLTVSNSRFTSNYSLDGGAINVRHSGDCCNVTISGSTFTNNFGFRFITRGGAIYIERGWASSSIVRITDSYFDNYRASTGGALYSRKVDMTIERSSFHNNTAHDLGAAIYRDARANPGTTLTVNNTTLYNNNRGTYYTATIYIITGATNWGGNATKLNHVTFYNDASRNRLPDIERGRDRLSVYQQHPVRRSLFTAHGRKSWKPLLESSLWHTFILSQLGRSWGIYQREWQASLLAIAKQQHGNRPRSCGLVPQRRPARRGTAGTGGDKMRCRRIRTHHVAGRARVLAARSYRSYRHAQS